MVPLGKGSPDGATHAFTVGDGVTSPAVAET
jgi:hypothetical protein